MRNEELLFAVSLILGVIYLLFSPIAAQQADYYNVWKIEHTEAVIAADKVANYDAMRSSLLLAKDNLDICNQKLNSAFGGLNLLLVVLMLVLGSVLGLCVMYLWMHSHRKTSWELWNEIPHSDRVRFGLEQADLDRLHLKRTR